MDNHWILETLTDLRAFAQQNDLDALAEQLDQTRLLATVELASLAAVADRPGNDATDGLAASRLKMAPLRKASRSGPV